MYIHTYVCVYIHVSVLHCSGILNIRICMCLNCTALPPFAEARVIMRRTELSNLLLVK